MFSAPSWGVPNPVTLEGLDLAVDFGTLSEHLEGSSSFSGGGSTGDGSNSTAPFVFGDLKGGKRGGREGESAEGRDGTLEGNKREVEQRQQQQAEEEEDADSNDSKLGKLLFRMDPAEAESFNKYRQEYNGYRRGAAHGAKGEVKAAQQVYGGKPENKRKREEDHMMRQGGTFARCAWLSAKFCGVLGGITAHCFRIPRRQQQNETLSEYHTHARAHTHARTHTRTHTHTPSNTDTNANAIIKN